MGVQVLRTHTHDVITASPHPPTTPPPPALRNICDNPNQVSVGLDWRDGERIRRIPIIVTANDCSKVFAPLVRDGRMKKFYWCVCVCVCVNVSVFVCLGACVFVRMCARVRARTRT